MTEKRPQNDQQPMTEIDVEVPENTEIEVETQAPEKKDKGGNNPKGANQYTSGRVDDRGRKS